MEFPSSLFQELTGNAANPPAKIGGSQSASGKLRVALAWATDPDRNLFSEPRLCGRCSDAMFASASEALSLEVVNGHLSEDH